MADSDPLMVGMFWGGLVMASVPILLTLGVAVYLLRRHLRGPTPDHPHGRASDRTHGRTPDDPRGRAPGHPHGHTPDDPEREAS